ncbi:hypothetical protein C0Q70_11378 [Pomacea canaliculata]|uniref:Saposin B-type domain-containing protein n=1 Tax=Pomacea canaliculata TaxID=400727 RepID=A0A2T7P5W6_POMCA|nr:uncharacterized protein LOC112566623 [Pomacea canaliculata]XP_025098674.1 uncharacterized protein LOC112566623 [Pomacea canaliculata]PVD28783.1 hypothetical protein C0Q70_11378 [Pomacea canaliculata]
MKIIVALALLAVAVLAYECPPDPTQGIDCFETEPGKVFCMTDGSLVCGVCGKRLAYCLGMMEGLLILESIDPSVCEGATAPECEQGISGPKIKG